MPIIKNVMTIKPDKSTEENRKFWDFVEKTANEAKSGIWQKGAVTRPETIEELMNLKES